MNDHTANDAGAVACLAALPRTNLLNMGEEESFDRLTRLAARTLRVVACQLSLIDEHQQFVKSVFGLSEALVQHDQSLSLFLCQYVVANQAPLLINDLRCHPQFHDHPVTTNTGIIAYAGVPLVCSEGYVLGALSVLDDAPREWVAQDLATLTDFAALVMTEIALRADIVERQDVALALRESEAFLSSIYEGVAESIFVADMEPDGLFRCISVNPAYQRNSSLSRAEVIGTTADDLFTPEMAAQVQERHRMCAETGLPITYEEYLTFHGEASWWLTTLHPLRDRLGQVHRIVGTSINITQRKHAEEQQQRLERKLLELQKYESMGVLAGGVAHDFNNLLTTVLGNVELATLEIASDSPAVVYLRQIETTARCAADLTRQMLAYAGRAKLTSQRLNLNALVAEMIHLLHVSIPKQTKLECDVTVVSPVEADPTQIRQVIMNLVLNAAEAIGSVPGRILITTTQIEADARYLAEAYLAHDIVPGSYVALTVADTGCGMDATTQARMFDPFFTTKPSGHGLGLAAVIGIIRRHGGTVRVESAPDAGTHFTVLLPVSCETYSLVDEPVVPLPQMHRQKPNKKDELEGGKTDFAVPLATTI